MTRSSTVRPPAGTSAGTRLPTPRHGLSRTGTGVLTPRQGLPRIEPLAATAPLPAPGLVERASAPTRLAGGLALAVPLTTVWVLAAVRLTADQASPLLTGLAAVAVPVVVALVGLALLLLPQVSYRRRDAAALLVPGWGSLLAFRVGHRAPLLPFRDWPPRRDELQRARRVRGHQLWVLTEDLPPGVDTQTPRDGVPLPTRRRHRRH